MNIPSQQKQFFQSRGSAKEAANSSSGGGPQCNNHQKSLPQQQPTTPHPPLLNTRHQSHSTHAILSSSSTGSVTFTHTVERRFKRRRCKRKVDLREHFWATDNFHKTKIKES